MHKHDYISADHRQLLTRHGLDSFQALWDLPLEPLDAPNIARGGNSQVFLLALATSCGQQKKFIVKRQQNYNIRTWRHPLSGVPTFGREFDNIQHCQRLDIPTLNVACYAQRKDEQGCRAVLVTEFLDQYAPLNKLTGTASSRQTRNNIIIAAAKLIRKLHSHRLQHRHLQPKHIFVNINNGQPVARLIDLEAMRFCPIGSRYRIADLVTLNRRLANVTNTERLRFFLTCLAIDSLNPRAKRMCRRIIKLTKKKKGPT